MPNQWMKRATHCSRGHRYTAANTIIRACQKHKLGVKRQCRKCKSDAMKIRRRDLIEANRILSIRAEPSYFGSRQLE